MTDLKYSATAEISMGILDGITVTKKIDGKPVGIKYLEREDITQAVIEYCEEENFFKK